VSGFSPLSKNVTDLIIKPGAFVYGRVNSRDHPHTRRPQDLSWCAGTVYIEDGADTVVIKETLAMIFDYPCRAGEPADGSSRKPRSDIALRCSSGVLDLVLESVSREFAYRRIDLYSS
jgi:hypothetical protein